MFIYAIIWGEMNITEKKSRCLYILSYHFNFADRVILLAVWVRAKRNK